MKNILAILTLTFSSLVCAQQIKFENRAFEKSVLTANPEMDKDHNGKISQEEAQSITELDLMELDLTNANDVKYFKNLKYLSLTINNIKTFEISDLEYLEKLYIARNNLKEFKISNLPALKTLACGVNPLEKVKIKDCPNIESLNIMDSQLKELNVTEFKKLKYLTVDGNKLKNLDLSSNLELIQISINNNRIDTIDITKNQKLEMHILYIDEKVKIIGTDEQMKKYNPGPRLIEMQEKQ